MANLLWLLGPFVLTFAYAAFAPNERHGSCEQPCRY